MKEKMKFYDKEIDEQYKIMKLWLIEIIIAILIFMVIFLLAERGNMNYTGVNETCNNCAKQFLCEKLNCTKTGCSEWESFVSEEIKKIDERR